MTDDTATCPPRDLARRARRRRPALVAAGMCLGVASLIGVTSTTLQAAPSASSVSMTAPAVFVGVEPVRLLDTRTGVGAAAPGPFGPGETRTLQVAGLDTVPTSATSVAINVTLPKSASAASTFVTIWPTGTDQPDTSVTNATAGQNVPNFAISKLGTSGRIEVLNNSGDTHIVIDIVGYYVPATVAAASGTGGMLYSGVGDPVNSMGDDGDFYLEQAEAEMYEKEDGDWGDPFMDFAADTGEPHMLSGEGAPAGSLGAIDDVYFDTVALQVFGPKTAGGWGPGTDVGPDGTGSDFLTGVGAPDDILIGADGDVYLDTDALEVYGPKSGGSWGPATPLDGGVELLTGDGVPDDVLDGDIGDLYLDITTLILYGPKTAGGWGPGSPLDGTPGQPTALTDSALSARTNGGLLSLSIGIGRLVLPFPADGVSVGSAITRDDANTFTFEDAGTYQVTYSLSTASLSLLGSGGLEVGGVATGDTFALASVGVAATGTTLVHAEAGDSLEFVLNGLSVVVGATFTGSFVVELIAVD